MHMLISFLLALLLLVCIVVAEDAENSCPRIASPIHVAINHGQGGVFDLSTRFETYAVSTGRVPEEALANSFMDKQWRTLVAELMPDFGKQMTMQFPDIFKAVFMYTLHGINLPDAWTDSSIGLDVAKGLLSIPQQQSKYEALYEQVQAKDASAFKNEEEASIRNIPSTWVDTMFLTSKARLLKAIKLIIDQQRSRVAEYSQQMSVLNQQHHLEAIAKYVHIDEDEDYNPNEFRSFSGMVDSNGEHAPEIWSNQDYFDGTIMRYLIDNMNKVADGIDFLTMQPMDMPDQAFAAYVELQMGLLMASGPHAKIVLEDVSEMSRWSLSDVSGYESIDWEW